MVVELFSMLRILYSFLLLEVYLCTIKLETPIDTTIESLLIFVLSKKLKKSSGIPYIGLLQLRNRLE